MTGHSNEREEAANRRGPEGSARVLTPEAKRALAEAVERRARRDAEAAAAPPPKEIDGVDAPEPVRYGDWENKGRASDF